MSACYVSNHKSFHFRKYAALLEMPKMQSQRKLKINKLFHFIVIRWKKDLKPTKYPYKTKQMTRIAWYILGTALRQRLWCTTIIQMLV